MRQILASFSVWWKSRQIKRSQNKFDKRSFIERKIRQFVTLQKPGAEDEESRPPRAGETSHEDDDATEAGGGNLHRGRGATA